LIAHSKTRFFTQDAISLVRRLTKTENQVHKEK